MFQSMAAKLFENGILLSLGNLYLIPLRTAYWLTFGQEYLQQSRNTYDVTHFGIVYVSIMEINICNQFGNYTL